MKVLGVDEAGRGAVLGPLVICGALIDEKDEAQLKELGVKDSKLLTPKQRERIAKELPKLVKYQLIIISPPEIDSNVGGENGSNLNWLEAVKTVELINMLQPEKALIDCPSPNTKAYHEYIAERLLHKKVKIITEHKADYKYLIVGAASILAKVTRDAEIEKIKKHVGEDCGPGYPANSITQAFLKKNWNKHPELFRHSWSTYKEVAGLKKQKKIGEF
ncbi:MAG TPA: ribonuclease HII [Candidatus Nanoarchaeia archaeon]|nr:ribonuclease HII [Candidatus Nanoarchaeia archaeon]